MPKRLDVTGKTFGRLTALKSIGPSAHGYIWLWRCACGNTVRCKAADVASGNTSSCGCLRRDTITKHGFLKGVMANRSLNNTKTKIYRAYHAMRQRCLNPKHSGFKNYGGRGITICYRWLHSFENFVDDVGSPPSPKHTIGRVNNEGPYGPSNFRWETRREQSANTRRSVRVTIGDETECLTGWARKKGLSLGCLRARVKRGITGQQLLAPSR